ncbi:taurine catabolism dioxygenase [Sistotremastrum niveocremeum HHB9708]|uniref:Taurine catabolism dioxygenase n=2 Tax=Sistotremastraceae TaxID=3402574 RepID=A0A164WMB5_9AGAM|nr:taurine catabolism dioxygenase [Sistotremastrum niveocremeum HHB9708]KZT40927.1 taurine catabolism dioxygenase [Sistotremastrum suecicum HHB10207 ss-3]
MVAPPTSPNEVAPLAAHEQRDETPVIGTRFLSKDTQLAHFLTAPNSDQLFADLAKLVAERGVVFFPSQEIHIDQMKQVMYRLGEHSGRPKESGLHKHPLTEDSSELGAEVSVISSEKGLGFAEYYKSTRSSSGWHTDITFEKVPSDYSMLKIHTLPGVGGDTLWASGYDAYDRLSPAFQKFLEGLTAVHNADFFNQYAKKIGIPIQQLRGNPANAGEDLTAVHPVIRTHPVTGFKTLFVNRSFTKSIVELSKDESDTLLEYLFRHIAENHILQVRYRWEKNDIALWDNRSTFHTATFDYESTRIGDRVVGIGEKPYFDAASKGRREALGLPSVHRVRA